MLVYNKNVIIQNALYQPKVSLAYLKHTGSMTKQQNLPKFCFKKSVIQKL